ncbi:CBO0543 family protein [Paraliobacillus zengyii]|uniref:CBO0543 family protein n=1 Tax=Paraliobacillus zengyii TaxID=2213194 RepID=UPI000DD41B97|nr:CBO0543 family protein [Paraliobacillus zengyii]
MSIDYVILIFIWIIGAFISIFFITKQQKKRFIFAALLFQSITWLNSLIHLELELIAFPIREFPRATDVLFATEYFLYPILYALYIIHEPKKHFLLRFIYLLVVVSGLVGLELILVHFTNLVVYIHYAWYLEWIAFFIMFMLTNYLYHWFHKEYSFSENEERMLQ